MPKPVLIVEDNDDDSFFMMRAFRSTGMAVPPIRVEDGQKAIHYLAGSGEFEDRSKFPQPVLVLLDIKLPFASGFDVLRWVREESACPNLPVIMLTSSNQERDVEEAYALGANAYLMKPSQGDECLEIARAIKRFWLDANILPAFKDSCLKKAELPGTLTHPRL